MCVARWGRGCNGKAWEGVRKPGDGTGANGPLMNCPFVRHVVDLQKKTHQRWMTASAACVKRSRATPAGTELERTRASQDLPLSTK